MTDAELVSKNVALMESNNKGGLLFSIQRESFAGNAGSIEWKGEVFFLSGGNFFYDTTTGEILIFCNEQFAPADIIKQYKEGSICKGYVLCIIGSEKEFKKAAKRSIFNWFRPFKKHQPMVFDFQLDKRASSYVSKIIAASIRAFNANSSYDIPMQDGSFLRI